MLTINHQGQNLSILFKNDPGVLRIGKHGFENVEQISCAIVGEDNIPKGVGSAMRSAQDIPDDLVGMELALGRALKRLTPDKEVRAQFWTAFYRAVNGERLDRVATELDEFADQLEEFLSTTSPSHGAFDMNPMSEAPAEYESPLGALRYNDNVIPFERVA